MKWQHRCSVDWLVQRRLFLTATDVKDLLPFTKTGRKRTVGNESYLKVWARKLEPFKPGDEWSYGAAARGHVLEPFAVERFNEEFFPKMFHWDDALVVRKASAGTAWRSARMR